LTPLTQTARHTTTPDRPRERRAGHTAARKARKQRSFDGLVASYVRELATSAETPRRPMSE
jgi:hypothetical protein